MKSAEPFFKALNDLDDAFFTIELSPTSDEAYRRALRIPDKLYALGLRVSTYSRLHDLLKAICRNPLGAAAETRMALIDARHRIETLDEGFVADAEIVRRRCKRAEWAFNRVGIEVCPSSQEGCLGSVLNHIQRDLHLQSYQLAVRDLTKPLSNEPIQHLRLIAQSNLDAVRAFDQSICPNENLIDMAAARIARARNKACRVKGLVR